MNENYNLIEAIDKRHSVRDYQSTADEAELLADLQVYIERISEQQGPFGNVVKVSLVSRTEDSRDMKLGTYGMIKGANHYLVVTVKKASNYLLDVGYQFERVVLYATSLGLGTVWMAGTFSRKHFADAIDLTDDEMPIVCPVGIEAKNKSFFHRQIAKRQTHVRRPYEMIFFKDSLTNRLTENHEDQYTKAFKAARLAPSSLNKQPWLAIKQGDNVHFFKTNDNQKSDIDLGIFISHFDLVIDQLGYQGQLVIEPNELAPNYIVTWKPISK